jgi:hypothetical protein
VELKEEEWWQRLTTLRWIAMTLDELTLTKNDNEGTEEEERNKY